MGHDDDKILKYVGVAIGERMNMVLFVKRDFYLGIVMWLVKLPYCLYYNHETYLDRIYMQQINEGLLECMKDY